MPDYVLWFKDVSAENLDLVGGKNASLGELTKLGVNVPPGFAVTSIAYDIFIEANGLKEFIEMQLSSLNINDVKGLDALSKNIRSGILAGNFPKDLEDAIISNYQKLCNLSKLFRACCRVSSVKSIGER